MPRPSPESWRTISRLLDEVLDLPTGERAAWQAALAERDPRAAANVSAWLEEFDHMQAGGFLEDRHAATPATAGLVGLEIGAYRLVELLGQGGMGTVWLAERRDGRFDQRVAVKLLNAAVMDERGVERFAREASILARLAHPGISQLYDAGVSEFGAPYLVLEYVHGEHIDRYCDQNRLGVTDRLHLFLDILASLAHAHANLVVHRDLKPANVMVTLERHVKLLDFGIAKLMPSDDRQQTATGTEGTALTPAYAAPEQLTGQDVTTATDVHALGLLLFELLTGRHPFASGAASPAALVEAVVHREPRRLVAAFEHQAPGDDRSVDAIAASRSTTVARLAQRLAGDLDTIVAKALKKIPGERYASVSALEADLRRYLRHEPIAARPDTIRYRAAKFVRRHRASVAFASAAVLALATGLAGTLLQTQRARQEAARADRQAVEATTQRDFARRQLARAEAINDLNAFLIADAAPAGEAFTARELLQRAEQIVTRQAEDPNGTRTDSLIAIGGMHGTVGETTRAIGLLRQAYDAALRQADPALKARAACELGRNLVKAGDIDRARRLIDEGLTALPRDAQFAIARVECHLDGSSVEMWADEGARAVEHADAARVAADAGGGVSPLMTLKLAMRRAEALRMAGRIAEADTAFSEANRLLVALGREDTERAGTLLNNWGLVLGALGRPRQAEEMLRRSIAVSVAGGSDARVEAISWSNLARLLVDLGRYREAVPLAERAVREARERGDAVVTDQSQLMAARAHVLAGQVDRGEALLNEVEARFRQMFPPTHAAFAAVATDRVRIAVERRQFDPAVALANAALTLVESNPRLLSSIQLALRHRAVATLRAGRPSEALADVERMLPLVMSAAPEGRLSATVGAAHLLHGEALTALGRFGEARTALTEAVRHLDDAAGADHPNARRARELLAQTTPSASVSSSTPRSPRR